MESGDERPYRSHTKPACVPCRRRKSRCKLEPHTAACLMCRAHGTECTFPNGRGKSTPQKRYSTEDSPIQPHPNLRTPAVATRPLNRLPPPVATSPQFSIVTQARNEQDTPLSLEADDDNPHILGPAVTGDNHVLADYLSNISGGQGIREIRPVEPGSSSSPVIFTKVQKRPLGLMVNSSPALHKLQTIEKLVEPWGPHLIDM